MLAKNKLCLRFEFDDDATSASNKCKKMRTYYSSKQNKCTSFINITHNSDMAECKKLTVIMTRRSKFIFIT